MTKNKSINNWYWAGMVCLPIFIYITLVSYFTPLMKEDFIHFPNSDSFFAIKESWDYLQYNYIQVSGRIHYLIWGLLVFSFNRTPFEEDFSQVITSIIAGLVFLILFINLFFLAYARKPIFNDKNDRIKLCIIFLLMMTILAEKGETIFWLVGRTNYLWAATLLSSVAVFYRLAFAHDDFLKFHRQPIKHFLFILFMMPLAIAAGMADYAGTPIVLGLLAFGLFYKIFLARKKLPLWCYIIFLSFAIGAILLFIAPGNYMQYNGPLIANYHELSIVRKLILHPLYGLRIFLYETFYLPLIILPIFFHWQKHIIVKGKNVGKGFLNRFINKMKKDKKFAMAVIYLLSAFGFVAVLVVFPRLSSRMYFSGTCIFLLACVLVIDFLFLSPNKLTNKLKLLQKHIVKKIIFITTSVLLAIYLSFILIHTMGFHREFESRVQSIWEQKEAGKEVITIKPYSKKYVYFRFGTSGPMNHRYGFWYWQAVTGVAWENVFMAKYYGVKKIILEEEKK